MDDDMGELRKRAGLVLGEHVMDELTRDLFDSIRSIRTISDVAFGHAQLEGMAIGQRRALERIGIRASDLVTAITEFVNQQS